MSTFHREPFIIGEIGINHNGSLRLALELIEHAAECGVDAVKFQKRNPDICVPDSQKNVMKYDTPWGDITYLEYKHKVEFWEEEYSYIDDFCKEKGIHWFASVWDMDSFEFIQKYNLEYQKVASPMLTNEELLKAMFMTGKYTFVSTGMSTMEEIMKVERMMWKMGCPGELMHCVSVYPLDNKHANLKMIPKLRAAFNRKVGYSGHEKGIQLAAAAVALGATSIEKHITLDRTMWGTDQSASLGKEGLRKLVRDCRAVKEALGTGVKELLPEEVKKRETLVK